MNSLVALPADEHAGYGLSETVGLIRVGLGPCPSSRFHRVLVHLVPPILLHYVFNMANQVGKRYLCEKCGSEFIVTKGGSGELHCCGQPMKLKQ
jgi:desulfoferrodoxin-like iron-binding protein